MELDRTDAVLNRTRKAFGKRSAPSTNMYNLSKAPFHGFSRFALAGDPFLESALSSV